MKIIIRYFFVILLIFGCNNSQNTGPENNTELEENKPADAQTARKDTSKATVVRSAPPVFVTPRFDPLEDESQDEQNSIKTRTIDITKDGSEDYLPSPISGEDNDIHSSVDVEAKFIGGESAFNVFFKDNFIYPPKCIEKKISGTIYLRFEVSKSGKISNISVQDSPIDCPEFNQESIRVMNLSPNWIPGQIAGRFVSSFKTASIPLQFSE